MVYSAREASVLFIHFTGRKVSEVDIHPHSLKSSGKKTERNAEKESTFSRIQLVRIWSSLLFVLLFTIL